MKGSSGCCRNRWHPVLTLAAGLWFSPPCLFFLAYGTEAKDDKAAISRGKKLYEVSCGSCHRASGSGAEGVASPLAGSPWVEGSAQRLVRIALHGVRGPIEVNGRTFNLEMPGFQNVFGDEDLSAILTYTRQAWGNKAPPVQPEMVATIRASTAARGDSWTAEELMQW
ncbi:cytochrome c [Acidobacteria bacterium AH-259-A15]|nr:cytochrome c [Acidobacteria bacterium AH-259-A15]